MIEGKPGSVPTPENPENKVREYIQKHTLIFEVGDGEHYPNPEQVEGIALEEVSVSDLPSSLENVTDEYNYLLVDSGQHGKPSSQYTPDEVQALLSLYEKYVDQEQGGYEVFFTSVPPNLATGISKGSTNPQIYSSKGEVVEQLLPERLKHGKLD